jgi:hypothetical protein
LLDRLADTAAEWIEADRAAKVAGLWLTIGAGAFVIVTMVWVVHQVRMIGGF